MTPDLGIMTDEAARAGSGWPLAPHAGIGYSDRQVRRWIAGTSQMSPEAEEAARAYARRMGVEVEERCPTCGQRRVG